LGRVNQDRRDEDKFALLIAGAVVLHSEMPTSPMGCHADSGAARRSRRCCELWADEDAVVQGGCPLQEFGALALTQAGGAAQRFVVFSVFKYARPPCANIT
jgi:hypothetical protein